jgi:hypothetical protein
MQTSNVINCISMLLAIAAFVLSRVDGNHIGYLVIGFFYTLVPLVEQAIIQTRDNRVLELQHEITVMLR